MGSGSISIRVNSITFPPAFLDFGSLERVRKSVRGRLREGGFLVLDEKLVSEEEVGRFTSFFGVKRLSAVVDVYQGDNGFLYREYLLVNPRQLVSKGWLKVLVIFWVEVMGGVYRGFDMVGKFKCGLVLSLHELRVMCVTYSKNIFRDILGFVDRSGFSDRREYERVTRPGEIRERVVEVGDFGDDVWVIFKRLGKPNEYGLEFKRNVRLSSN